MAYNDDDVLKSHLSLVEIAVHKTEMVSQLESISREELRQSSFFSGRTVTQEKPHHTRAAKSCFLVLETRIQLVLCNFAQPHILRENLLKWTTRKSWDNLSKKFV